ncbi:MAG TPA: hypothetical protein VD695_00895, partial [Gaiellaceae bacterium]|nr:hypothetical protein [Gaiellaceae bacterium]
RGAAAAVGVLDRLGPFGHLAATVTRRDVLWVFCRRPEPALGQFEVDAVFRALWDIQGLCRDILRILREEDDGEAEADEH